MIEQIRNIFIEEVTQQLYEIEADLKTSAAQSNNQAVVEKVFLIMHSIKGSGPMVGFHVLPHFTMPVEKAYAKIRKGELSVSAEIIDKTNDLVRLIIDALNSKTDKNLAEVDEKEELLNFFRNLCS